jgi:hypothetical protein
MAFHGLPKDVERRVFLAGLGLAVIACGKSGSDFVPSGPTEDSTPGGPSAGKAPSPIGYSHVARLNAGQAEEVFGAGLTLVQAEACPFNQGAPAFDAGRLRGIAEVTRRYGGTFFLTLVNWNGRERHESTGWFRDRVTEILDKVGPSNVWFEGVSEPDPADPKALAWQRAAREMWPGILVGNGPGGRGTPAVRSDVVDWHYCNINDLIRNIGANRLHSTDCTPALASNISEDSIRKATRAAVSARARFILYDTFDSHQHRPDVIRWMAEELPRA